MIKRGDVFFAELNETEEGSSVQSGLRPVIIIQNDKGNAYSPTTIVVPLTSKKKRKHLPTHVLIEADKDNGLKRDSVALLEQVQTINKTSLLERLGHIVDMVPVNKALMVSAGLA